MNTQMSVVGSKLVLEGGNPVIRVINLASGVDENGQYSEIILIFSSQHEIKMRVYHSAYPAECVDIHFLESKGVQNFNTGDFQADASPHECHVVAFLKK